jgi:putative SOS response-associated peptidase YedK
MTFFGVGNSSEWNLTARLGSLVKECEAEISLVPRRNDLLTSCLITTDANAVVSPVHNRMPVILTPEAVKLWLDKNSAVEELTAILTPADDDLLVSAAVSKSVNSPKNDGPECVEPAGVGDAE